MMAQADAHCPYPLPIDSYGNGGFRFGDMSHKGSMLFLARGIWDWQIINIRKPGIDDFAFVSQLGVTGHLILGTGEKQLFPDAETKLLFHSHGIRCEPMTTASAARTYNILLAEGRPVSAALIAV